MGTFILYSGFVASVLLAVFGNLIVYVRLVRRGIPVRFVWAGTPGYLYRTALRVDPAVAASVRALALVSVISFFLAFVLGAVAFMFTESPTF